jgi:hypothetical protein
MAPLYYVAWQGQVFVCTLRTHVRQEVSGKPAQWFALVDPAGVAWFPAALVRGDGAVLIPSDVLRKTREEAEADVSLAALRRTVKASR